MNDTFEKKPPLVQIWCAKKNSTTPKRNLESW
jgi:hypothetical protein